MTKTTAAHLWPGRPPAFFTEPGLHVEERESASRPEWKYAASYVLPAPDGVCVARGTTPLEALTNVLDLAADVAVERQAEDFASSST